MYVGKEQWLSLLYLIVLQEHTDASFGTTLFKLQYVATSRLRSVLVSRMTRVRSCGDAMFSEASFQVKSSFFGALHTGLSLYSVVSWAVYARDGVDDAALHWPYMPEVSISLAPKPSSGRTGIQYLSRAVVLTLSLLRSQWSRWYSIGAHYEYNGGFPGPTGIIVSRVELWVSNTVAWRVWAPAFQFGMSSPTSWLEWAINLWFQVVTP